MSPLANNLSHSALPKAVFNDFSTLDALRAGAAGPTDPSGDGEVDKRVLEEAATQFAAIFLHMALKSMREASLGEGLLDSQQSEFYRDMFDEQLSLELSGSKGFGLARLIVNQLAPDSGRADGLGEIAHRAYTHAAGDDKPAQDSADPADRSTTRSIGDQS